MRHHTIYRHLDALYRSLGERWRTEDVAVHIAPVVRDLVGTPLWRKLERIGRSQRTTSMSRRFDSGSSMAHTLKTARGLFPDVRAARFPDDPEAVRAYIDRLNAHLQVQHHSFMHGRMDRQARTHAGLEYSKRAYNKRFRFVTRLERRYRQWRKVEAQARLAQVAKTKLAYRISRDEALADPLSTCFVAYLTAKLGRRSLFTWGRQPRAYDEIADALFQALDPAEANWRMIAYVHPVPDVLERLDDEARGQLLGEWYAVMRDAARSLDGVVRRSPKMELDTLVVRRGDDSSTFNEAAGAFNAARTGWINTLHVLGLDRVLDAHAPPKALRLMAADVVYMHRRWGSGALEPDTLVWQSLPKPWDVVLGRAECARPDIERACRRAGVSGKGWIAPREKRVAHYAATPELVHGVVVKSPELASRLRRAGWYAGPSKWS